MAKDTPFDPATAFSNNPYAKALDELSQADEATFTERILCTAILSILVEMKTLKTAISGIDSEISRLTGRLP